MSDTPHSELRIPHFVHQRHKPPSPLSRPRELIPCLAPMRSNVNLSNIVRTAGCSCCNLCLTMSLGVHLLDRSPFVRPVELAWRSRCSSVLSSAFVALSGWDVICLGTWIWLQQICVNNLALPWRCAPVWWRLQ